MLNQQEKTLEADVVLCAIIQGILARQEGLSRIENPFEKDSLDAEAWLFGWASEDAIRVADITNFAIRRIRQLHQDALKSFEDAMGRTEGMGKMEKGDPDPWIRKTRADTLGEVLDLLGG